MILFFSLDWPTRLLLHKCCLDTIFGSSSQPNTFLSPVMACISPSIYSSSFNRGFHHVFNSNHSSPRRRPWLPAIIRVFFSPFSSWLFFSQAPSFSKSFPLHDFTSSHGIFNDHFLLAKVALVLPSLFSTHLCTVFELQQGTGRFPPTSFIFDCPSSFFLQPRHCPRCYCPPSLPFNHLVSSR